jgi:hypothetical protein
MIERQNQKLSVGFLIKSELDFFDPEIEEKGGSGSGNYGHAGRSGKVGGSAAGSGGGGRGKGNPGGSSPSGDDPSSAEKGKVVNKEKDIPKKGETFSGNVSHANGKVAQMKLHEVFGGARLNRSKTRYTIRHGSGGSVYFYREPGWSSLPAGSRVFREAR